MRIELEGCLNFRDLGGYPTKGGARLRHRLLYRSDALHHLSADDVRRLRDEIGIISVLDLRSSGELRNEGRGRLEHEPIAFHHVPLFEGDTNAGREQARQMSLADTYFLLAEFAKSAVARVVTLLSECDGPAVYHCAAGKDRTGVISAVLLGLLDVDNEVIVADYALSSENLDAIVERLMASQGYKQMFAALPPETLHANPETMTGFLERLAGRYGSISEYALSAGIDAAAIDQLKRRLLEPA